ncbi:MAG: Dihydroorotate dehydrogenase B (NAD(+)), catalytic subunit [Candidatus Thorarchaeota archaeon]|nr:MAG: Dihydroorotate dehydrogenase B (NAD(+)), catalytic subunit [Candidatus Thorarchaeota archaeon]
MADKYDAISIMPSSLLLSLRLHRTGLIMRIEGYWLASGILGVTAAIMHRVIRSGADVVVTKSIGPHPRKGHPGPVITSAHGGLVNAVGLTNPGIDAFVDEIRQLKNENIPVVLSVFGNSPDEIAEVVTKGTEAKPDAFELNLSCPHAEIGLISHSPKLTYDYVKTVRDITDIPIYAKITPNASDIEAVALSAEKAGADAVVAINTLRGMRIDIYQKRPVLGNLVGGLSGPPVLPVAIRCVYDLFNVLDVPIIGVGGVTTWKDAIEMHLAGARAIQIGTAVLKGLDVFSEIKQGVEMYLEEQGMSSTIDIVGLAGRR